MVGRWWLRLWIVEVEGWGRVSCRWWGTLNEDGCEESRVIVSDVVGRGKVCRRCNDSHAREL